MLKLSELELQIRKWQKMIQSRLTSQLSGVERDCSVISLGAVSAVTALYHSLGRAPNIYSATRGTVSEPSGIKMVAGCSPSSS